MLHWVMLMLSHSICLLAPYFSTIFQGNWSKRFLFSSAKFLRSIRLSTRSCRNKKKWNNILMNNSQHPGDPYIIPRRLSQDVVECFFSIQRQACGGTNNMTAFTYGYNVNSVLASSIKIASKKQTNVFDSDDVELEQNKCGSTLPKRVKVDGIMKKSLWPVHLE